MREHPDNDSHSEKRRGPTDDKRDPAEDSGGSKEDREARMEGDIEAEMRNLIVDLSREFYRLGWMTGTGGAISIKVGEDFLVTPSGILKERQSAQDIFRVDSQGIIVRSAANPTLVISSCLPNFLHIYRLRDAGCIFHLHSIPAVLVSVMWPGQSVRCRHLQMIKGMRGHGWEDMLEIPIIENRATEDAIAEGIEVAVRDNPKVDAVIIRRHGLYVWGRSWTQAKIQAESLDWLFKVALEMKKAGLDPEASAE